MPATINHNVKRFKSPQIALKELEPFIRNGDHLQSGKPFANFSDMRSREAVANWLTCAAINFSAGSERLTFTSDPVGGDGVILDAVTGETWPTEHVMVPRQRNGEDIGALILEMVEKKWQKGGAAYAKGKTLIVFLNVAGEPWLPNLVAKELPTPMLFEAVWVVGLHSLEGDRYVYNVTRLDIRQGHAPVWRISIAENFGGWTVAAVQ